MQSSKSYSEYTIAQLPFFLKKIWSKPKSVSLLCKKSAVRVLIMLIICVHSWTS